MQKPLTGNPWIVSGIFLLVLYLLIKAGSSRPDLILSAIWTALAVICVTMVVHMIRRRYRGPYSQADVMSTRWRSWIYDERANRR